MYYHTFIIKTIKISKICFFFQYNLCPGIPYRGCSIGVQMLYNIVFKFLLWILPRFLFSLSREKGNQAARAGRTWLQGCPGPTQPAGWRSVWCTVTVLGSSTETRVDFKHLTSGDLVPNTWISKFLENWKGWHMRDYNPQKDENG